MSAVAANDVVRILLLRRANQEHQNAGVPVTETELPSGLFRLRRKMPKIRLRRDAAEWRHAWQIIPLLAKGFSKSRTSLSDCNTECVWAGRPARSAKGPFDKQSDSSGQRRYGIGVKSKKEACHKLLTNDLGIRHCLARSQYREGTLPARERGR